MGIGNHQDSSDGRLPALPELEFRMTYGGERYKTSILSKEIVMGLREALQDKYKYSLSWKLLFSTFENGFSYRTFLSSFERDELPFVLACRTRDGELFGAFFEDRIRVSRTMYGRPSTFLFTTAQNMISESEDGKVAVFPVSQGSGANIYCTPDFLAFGCSGERFGLLIDRSLSSGETHPVETFGKAILASNSHFQISYLELWLIQL
ncbi:oxidation resistance protein [Encephalitozoon intestinalis ATCC 50506]|uniref:Oxidation resistance protein n=1 Tax=Encephalitozoon intestinalis (strain ATCC 50506) TaxID=876142 RepID=E0S817_ENCIT|nr:oxidation resistance protein [Encephalitozoon intestinalis ATCC 50506]ADM11852.1 oxidation resistance protein [Encephalitozoon intestinalis ATCC 50506]UTX45604.1 TLD domain-containing protein [Encephalitozoon intestinalis]